MEERGMNERVRMLRRQSVETQPHIYMERAKLMTEAYKLYDGSMSVPEMRATALKYYFQHKTIEIADGELIVGEKGDTAQAAPHLPGAVLPYASGHARHERPRAHQLLRHR